MNASPHVGAAACDYCGLPVGGGWGKRDDAGNESSHAPLYCCYGCRFAAAVAQERGEVGQLRWNLTRLGLAIFFSMNVMVFTLVLWSLDVFPESETQDATKATLLWDLFRYLCLLFSLPVLLMLGGPLLDNTLKDLRRGFVGTDLLLAIGVAAAYVYSAVSVFRGQGHVYFEVGCMILVAVTLGRWLEATGKWKATDALKSLARLLPEQVQILTGGKPTAKPLADVQPGDQVRILAGQRIPVDGTIRQGQASIDEQIVTGESQPVAKAAGDAVYGGTLNLDGMLDIEATATASDGSLQRLIDAVAAAAAASDRWRRLADRVSGVFTPLVLAIALATFAGHWLLADFQHGLLAGLAVLLIACPCALGVATPLATWSSMGAASRRGVLFRDGDALARLAGVRAICLDKTGTLTDGALRVERLVVEDPADRESLLRHAAALSGASTHIVSLAIGQHVQTTFGDTEEFPAASCSDVEIIPGRGVLARVHLLGGQGPRRAECVHSVVNAAQQPRRLAGRGPRPAESTSTVLLGNQRLMDEQRMRPGPRLLRELQKDSADEHSCCYIAWEGRVRGVFLLSESLRPSSRTAIDQLRRLNVHVCVLTGDRRVRGRRLEKELGISVKSELLPEDKLAEVKSLQRHYGCVAMVGDGINDAPALAAADVGIALGCGADVSRETADVCLTGDDLVAGGDAIRLARAAQRTIRQNLIWAFSYNAVGIAIAVAGWLNPMLAAVAMAGSSLFVVSNSLKLSRGADRNIDVVMSDEVAATADDDRDGVPSAPAPELAMLSERQEVRQPEEGAIA